jgi:hypothetical protein
MAHILDHPQSTELDVIRVLIDATPPTCPDIIKDLNRGETACLRAGAKGMSAEHVLRCLDVKTLLGFSNQELDTHIFIRAVCAGSAVSAQPTERGG